jgi:beta-glucosidase
MNWLFSRQKHRAPALLALTFTVTACSQPPATQTPEAQAPASAIWPQLKVPAADAALELKINSLLAEMTLAQKVAQVIQPDIRWMSVADMRQYGFGSYLNGGGAYPNDNKQASAADWAALADAYTKAAVDASLDGSTIPPL